MNAMPPLLARWTERILGFLPPDEPLSDCADCPCAGISLPAVERCCSEPAVIVNFHVGRALDVPTVRARIAQRRGVTPAGLTRFTGDLSPDRPGCPHLDGTTCSAYEARPTSCVTFFCRFERSLYGAAAWAALRDALHAAEARVALWAAREVGLEAAPLRLAFGPPDAKPVDGPAPVADAVWAARWGRFAGREESFFDETARLADALAWDDVSRIGGVEVEVLAANAAGAFAQLAPCPLPARLAVAEHSVIGVGPDALRIVTWSRHQPIDVSALAHSVLCYFDGRPTDEALAAMAEERGVLLDEALIRRLFDARILVEAGR